MKQTPWALHPGCSSVRRGLTKALHAQQVNSTAERRNAPRERAILRALYRCSIFGAIFDVRPVDDSTCRPLPGPGPSRSSVQMQGIARGRLAEERKAWRKVRCS